MDSSEVRRKHHQFLFATAHYYEEPIVLTDGKGTRLTDLDGKNYAEATLRLFEETKKRGLLIGKGGLYGNVIRVAPALTISAGEIDDGLAILGDAFEAMR